MKHIKTIITFLLVIVIITACEKSKDFIEDNSDPTSLGSRPVSTNAFIDIALPRTALEGKAFASGATFTTELQFFSESPVKEIVVYSTIGKVGARNKLNTYAYDPKAFSLIKRADTLLIPFTVPAIAKDTVVKIDVEIVNQNTLSLIRTVSIKGK